MNVIVTATPVLPTTPAVTCAETEFTCDNGECVPGGPDGVVCNGINNCGDASDEAMCGKIT